MNTNLRFVLSISMALILFSLSAQEDYWTEVTKTTNDIRLNEKFVKSFQLNLERLKSELIKAPLRNTSSANSSARIHLPTLDGDLHEFLILEAPVLSESLAQEFPEIKTYVGFSTRTPGVRARFSVTPQGLQTMVSYPNHHMEFIVPAEKGDSVNYILYSRDARESGAKSFECLSSEEFFPLDKSSVTSSSRDANDQLLRTFRIAISTTGQYTNFWDDGNDTNGNAQQDAFAQVVATLNRSIEVFEVDMAISFTLVSGLNIIFPNPATDPYSSTSSFSSQLQSTLTTNVGEANYDVGHLFAYLAGGNSGFAGCIGCVCDDGQKGRGWSGHTFLDNDGGPYMSDFFDIDYVPHEIGHQLGANHTWSFASEGAGVNVEPGSGTTIMGYAGITGPNDIQDHTDPYFHYVSILQILNNLQSKTCWVGTTVSNNPPIADAGPDYTIPSGTAFVLKGSATDPDGGDVLTYSWEQIDNGVTTSGNFGPNKTTGAVWRSRPPSTSSDRFMPIVERVISGQLTETNPIETVDNSSWETVSNVSRSLNFALTVRDRSEANGSGQSPQSSFDTMRVTVDGGSGPFEVTSQSTNEVWNTGTNQNITWNVAGTDGGAVNTPTVNILLSVDGGITYPFTLASNVPNDGVESVTVPFTGAGDVSTARVKVEGNNTIFYAINSSNFSIDEDEFQLDVASNSIDVCTPNNAIFNFTYNTASGFNDTTTFSATGLPGGTAVVFNPTTANSDGTAVTATISGIGNLATGNYQIDLVGTSGAISNNTSVEFNVFDANLSMPSILSPADGSTDIPIDNTFFSWTSDTNSTAYEIDIATDAGFNTIVNSGMPIDANFTVSTLNADTQYFWRVRGVNSCGNGPYAQGSFTTVAISCQTYNTSDTPITIPDADPSGVSSIINVPTDFAITDVNVTVSITHTFVQDLILTLIAPDGSEIILSNRNGGDGDDYISTVFDQEASISIGSGTAPFTGSFIPDEDLSTLYNGSSLGNWQLRVSDNAGLDVGTIDEFSLELCVLGSLSTDEFTEKPTFKIYPNPNNGSFTVRLNAPSNDNYSLEVYDINGRRIYNAQKLSGTTLTHQVNLNTVASGIYLVRLRNDGGEVIRKIVVD